MEVNVFNLERDHSDIKEELIDKFREVLERGEYILGSESKAFEDAFSAYIGTKYAVGVGSGTDALKIGGLACNLKAGDKFVTTPNTYISTAMSLSIHGIVPVFCDIELDTYNMDPEMLAHLLKKERGIKLCIPVHLYGHPCKMDEIVDICIRHGVMVMEDACQAHGALYKERKVGGLSDLAAFSFYPTKNLGCYGDGGMITTNSEDIYKKALMLRIYGQSSKHVHDIEGFNSRLDEIQAALLSIKLKKLDSWNKKRRHIVWLYRRELEDTPVILPYEAPWAYHVYHLYVIRVKERDELMGFLKEKGISTLIHYPTPIHLQEVYKRLGYKKGAFLNAEKVSAEIISLPIYPSMKEDEVLYVARSIREFYGMKA
ncbi:MAG TPA: DegT/DnrJ/EryC1/StrS family aminotransferase [Syntrophorhabdaceae bacterium]|nr:DegT/DnrJ/EryC1/StrS family aminotransferase [Syntrophorhabdaceae bacterium]